MSVQGPNVAAMGATGGTQLSFADLAHAQGAAWTPADEMSLRETTFVVVDLETTGGRTTGNDATPPDAITEIGAVKVCGGAVLGEFATLVNPQHSIPPQIVRLTGITTAMVGNAPTIDAVLPMFFEFAGDSVLVAHNAGFDIGFLRAAARRCDITWPQPQVLCTMRLARRVLSRDEAPSVRLAALARLFAVASNPTHRALDDARATVDVLHALIERVGNQGVHTYAELRSYLPNVTQAQRCKRVLAETLPHRPGVYLFRGPSGEVLYVGTAADLRRRVSQYFNGTDRRKRMTEMVMLASSIDHVECAHPLEAGVRELRMLSTHAPPYNRRSKFPYRWWWVALTDEAFPRLSVIRAPRHDRVVGPFRSRSKAAETAALLARCTGLRTCTTRLTRSARHGPACPELEVSACPAARDVTAAQYAEAVLRAAALIGGLDNAALAAAVQQVTELAERRRYESAARLRDHLATAIEALWHGQRLRALAALPELIAQAGRPQGGRLPTGRHSPRPTRRCRQGTARGSSDACGRRHPPRRSGDPAYAGTARRGTGGGDRAHRPLAGRAGSAHRRGLERRRRVGLPSALGRPVGSVGGNGALGPVGRRAAQQRLAVRSADRTAPIARATVRPHRCRLPHWPAATPPPRPAAIQHGWIIRRGRRSHRRR